MLTPFHVCRNVCHQAKSALGSALRWTQWSRSSTVEAASIRSLRNALPGLTTEDTWESRPVDDRRLRFLPEPRTWESSSILQDVVWPLVFSGTTGNSSSSRSSTYTHPDQVGLAESRPGSVAFLPVQNPHHRTCECREQLGCRSEAKR